MTYVVVSTHLAFKLGAEPCRKRPNFSNFCECKTFSTLQFIAQDNSQLTITLFLLFSFQNPVKIHSFWSKKQKEFLVSSICLQSKYKTHMAGRLRRRPFPLSPQITSPGSHLHNKRAVFSPQVKVTPIYGNAGRAILLTGVIRANTCK